MAYRAMTNPRTVGSKESMAGTSPVGHRRTARDGG
jgi:hypothetical protein